MIVGLLTLWGIKFHDTIHAAIDGAFREARGTKEAQPVETMEKAFAKMDSERFRLAQDRPTRRNARNPITVLVQSRRRGVHAIKHFPIPFDEHQTTYDLQGPQRFRSDAERSTSIL